MLGKFSVGNTDLNALEETSVIQLELRKEFGGTGPHLEVELEKVFQLLWSLLYMYI